MTDQDSIAMPMKQVPLTEPELLEMLRQVDPLTPHPQLPEVFKRFARAIEAKHGIK